MGYRGQSRGPESSEKEGGGGLGGGIGNGALQGLIFLSVFPLGPRKYPEKSVKNKRAKNVMGGFPVVGK